MKYVALIISVFFIASFVVPAWAQDVFIIDVESNPAGPDGGNEWILLFNPGIQPVDLSGWRVVTADGGSHLLDQTIPACDRIEVRFPEQFIDNNNEILTLFDSENTKIDETPPISDAKNDDDIWSTSVPKCEGSLPPPSVPSVPIDILEITFVDLGSAGESILLVAPEDATMLIDGGLARSYNNLKQVMNDSNVDSIDIMVATHADQDHIEGLTSVILDSDIDVEYVFLSHIAATTKTYANFIESIRSMQIPSEIAYAGHTIALSDSIPIQVISPPMQGISDSSSLRNTNTLVLYMEYGAISFLFTGDATSKTERWIVQNIQELDIDIMNGPHHGSHHSSTELFLDHVTPQLVIFSADADNRYGHPHHDVVSRYDNRGIANYQTGIDGSIKIRTDGVGCSIILKDSDEVPCYDGILTVDSTQDMLPVNHPPTVNAGSDQTVNEGEIVTINATVTNTEQEDSLIYTWTSSPGLTLSNPHTEDISFTAPQVSSDAKYTLTLSVSDGVNLAVTDSVTVTVKNIPPPAITGTVFVDTDGDGVQDIDEAGYPDYTMIAIDVQYPTMVRTTTTDADGMYSFDTTGPGTTLVQTGFFPAGYTVLDDTMSWFRYVTTTAAGMPEPFDVGFYPVPPSELTDLTVTVYEDTNRNGQHDTGESGIPGIGIVVYTYTIGGPILTTNADGVVTATPVPADFIVYIHDMAGYAPTAYNYERSDDITGKQYDTDRLLADDPEPGSTHTIKIGLAPV